MAQGPALFPWRTVIDNVATRADDQPAPRSQCPPPDGAAGHGGPRRLRRRLPVDAVGRDAAAGRARPHPGGRRRSVADGRAVRRPRRDDQGDPRRRGAGAVATLPAHRAVGDPSPARSGEARRPGHPAVTPAGHGDRRHRRAPPPAPGRDRDAVPGRGSPGEIGAAGVGPPTTGGSRRCGRCPGDRRRPSLRSIADPVGMVARRGSSSSGRWRCGRSASPSPGPRSTCSPPPPMSPGCSPATPEGCCPPPSPRWAVPSPGSPWGPPWGSAWRC